VKGNRQSSNNLSIRKQKKNQKKKGNERGTMRIGKKYHGHWVLPDTLMKEMEDAKLQ